MRKERVRRTGRTYRSIFMFYLNTYILPYGVLLLICLKAYSYLPGEVKANVFNHWPDGRIVFSSNRDGNWELYTMSPDGADVERLTNTPDIYETQPVWSPDGTCIAFVSLKKKVYDIEIISLLRNVRWYLTNDSKKDLSPAWSPDGKEVAFVSYRDGNAEIYVIARNGEDLRDISQSSYDDIAPGWDPLSGRIFFLRIWDDPKADFVPARVYSATSSGTEIRMMSEEFPYLGNVPIWSRDGKKMAFIGGGLGNVEGSICYLKRGKIHVYKIVDDPRIVCDDPAWSPDARSLVFSGHPAETGYGSDIYVVTLDGKNLLNLTSGNGDNKNPDWFSGYE